MSAEVNPNGQPPADYEKLLEYLKSVAVEAQSVQTQAVAARTQIADHQAVIATKSDHIQNAQLHADKVRGDLDRVLTTAAQHAADVEGQSTRATRLADECSQLLTKIHTAKAEVDAASAAVASARLAADEATEVTKSLAGKAADVEQKIAEYEKRLIEIEAQCHEQLKTITDLLPGATSVGLAHAFDQRRATFLKPQNRWQWIFIGSVAAIVILAASGLFQALSKDTIVTYDELARLWLARLPIAAALVWLAIHSSRESALAKRLEEDYGYKSAVAASFVGFHKQLLEVGAKATENPPLATLCKDTLLTIATPPGRIYEREELVVSPSTEAAKAAKAVKEVMKPAGS